MSARVAWCTSPMCLVVLLAPALAAFAAPAATAEPAGEAAYLGRWDLTLHAPNRDYPSWLELTDTDGTLRARLVSRWGHARFLPEVSITDGHLRFVSPKSEEERKDDMVFDGQLVGQTLEGVTSGQDGTPWTWWGARAPSPVEFPCRAPAVRSLGAPPDGHPKPGAGH